MLFGFAALLTFAGCSSDANGPDAGGGSGTAGTNGIAGAGGDGGRAGALGTGGDAGTGGIPGNGGAGGRGGADGNAPTLRDALPAVMDDAVVRLNEIPGSSRTDAIVGTLEFLQTTCTRSTLATRVCLADISDSERIAESAGEEAFVEASNEITEPKAAMLELKKRALEADDPSLREALRQALGAAYANRTVTVTVSVMRTFGRPFSRDYIIYSADTTHTVIDEDIAARIHAAESDLSLLEEPYPPLP